MNNALVQRSKEALVTDLKVIVGDAEQLIKDMASSTAEDLAAARSRIEAKLAEARKRIDGARVVLARRASDAADATGEYISENPWKVVGVASLVGLVVALLIFRRS